MNPRMLFPALTYSRCSTRRLAKWPLLIGATLLAVAAANATDRVWIGGTGNWDAAANWSPAQVPGPADNVFITNTGNYTVLIDKPDVDPTVVGSLTLGGDSGTQTLSVGNVVLILNGASAVNANGLLELTLNSSELIGPGTVTVDGTLNWAGGTIGGPGGTSVGNSGVINLIGNATLLTRTLDNNGTVNWSAGNLGIDEGAVINNLPDGTFNIGFAGNANTGGAPGGVFNNAGAVNKTGALAANIVLQFNNTGTVNVQFGTLSLDGGGTHTGTFSTAAGAGAEFGGGNHVLTAASVVTESVVLTLSGAGTLNASGIFGAGSILNVISGTATLTEPCDVTAATVNISGTGGTVIYNSSGTVGTVNVTAGTLGGTSPVTVTGLLTLAGGTVSNPLVTADGGLNISGGVTLNGGKLINPGTAVWSAGNFTGASGAVFSNLVGATFINTFDGNAPSGAGATPTFVNAGLFQKTNGTAALGTTSIDFQFMNTGTVEVQTNTLRYAINQQTAGLTLLNGGNLTAQAQPIQLLGGSLVGTGLVTVANAQNVINSAAISPGLPLGRMDIAGNYQQTASGVLNIELGGYSPGTNFDLITVIAGGAGGVATLGGTLNITLANGFSPTNGATFAFLTALSRVGAFTTFNYPSNDIGMQVTYDLTSTKVTVSNLKPVVTNPTVDPAPGIYGSVFNFQFPIDTFTDPDNNPLSYTASGMPPGITFAGATRTFAGTPTQAGVFPVTVFANDGGTPNLIATNAFTITVSPANLTIAAEPQNKFYGAIDPVLTYTVGGLQFADTPAFVLTGALDRVVGETVAGSPYAISQGTLTPDGNYTISFTGNTLTIGKASLSVTADAKTKNYGMTDPAFTVTYDGFVNSETLAVLGGTLGFGRASGEVVGSYLITPGGLTSANYAITFNTGSLSITKAALTVTAAAKTKTYGVADPELTFTMSGLQFSDTGATVLTGALDRTAGESVAASPYAITQGTLAANGNYTISFTGNTLTVNKASLSVTADAKTKIYGATDPAFTVTYAGFVNSETSAVLDGTLGFTRAPGESVGSYLITPSGLASGNYAITFNAGTLSVTKAVLSIAAEPVTKTYGTSDPALTFTVTGLQSSDTPATVLTGALTRTAGETVATDPYAITQGTLTPNGNYTISFTGSTLTITKASLSVTADAKTKTYGTVDPAFTVTYVGFANGETATVLGGTLTFNRASGENVGTYVISPSGLTSGNYAITFNAGALSITKAVLSVAADPLTKTYGAIDPTLTFRVTGLQFSDTPATVFTGVLTRVSGETVSGGPYTITQGTLTADDNYTIAFNTGTLSITKAALSITADNKIKTYGASDPTFTANYVGFVNSETPALLAGTLAFTRAPGENVGDYLITPGGLTSGNYALTFNTGTLSITKAALSVTADSKTKTYGAADPTFTASYLGFVNSETPAVLGGTLGFTRAPGESVGSYLITPSGLTSGNYAITFNPGTLSVTKAALSVTADARTKTYGTIDPAFTVSYAGFVNGETPAVLGGTLVLARAPGENVGSYPITPSGLTSGDYTITFNTGSLGITTTALSVNADNKTKTYGTIDPAFTVSYAGFVNGETPAVLGGTLVFARAPGENVGSYLITPSGLASANYSLTFNTGTLTIAAPAPVILSLARSGATDIVITWAAVSNATYRVQYKTELNAVNWNDLPGDITASSVTASKTDIITTTNRFYRVQVLP